MQVTKNVKFVLTSIILINLALLYWSSQNFDLKKSINYITSFGQNKMENFIQNENDPEDLQDDTYIESVTDKIEPKRLDDSLRLPDKCEQVIVLTTINDPTPDVKYMRDSLYGWCVLVVFDKKTPKNWSYKDTFFLSLTDQITLAAKYSIIEMIPYNFYTRKMIGYLFAIENGAKYIYETDDDNAPLDGLFGFRYKNFKGLEPSGMECDQDETKFFNPYSYFGQPSVWPRGYPLEKISDNHQPLNKKCNKLNYRIYDKSTKVPLIQQGLVNGDPDVDAIYRLTRKNDPTLNIEFDSNAPPLVLNRNQYAPTNSQNTFWAYDSFFLLIFPMNTTFREVDILRGYISIRLLNEINGRVSFMPPNAIQIRNAHSYHKDYLDEKRLYESIYKFVYDLDKWTCDETTIQACVLSCIANLIEMKHLDEKNLDFYKAWIKDLTNIGYRWPKINRPSSENRAEANIIYKSIEQEHSSNSNKNEKSLNILKVNINQKENLEKYCESKFDTNLNSCKFNKFILITKVSSIKELSYAALFINVHFPYVIICINENSSDLFLDYVSSMNSTLNGISILKNPNFKACVNSAFQIGFKQQSFIIAKDLSKFYFWSSTIQLVSKENPITSSSETIFDTDFYLIRRTVADAIKQIQIADYEKKDETKSSFCLFYKNSVEDSLCSNLKKQISNLIWHTNDLPSESCENIDKSKIWIPEVHDGPRADITSTLAHLGQTAILAGYKGIYF
jgi:hypothetical protein